MEAENPLPCPSNLTLERYELGELPPVQLTALHAHLRQCERCRRRLEQMDTQAAGYRRSLSALNARNALHKAEARWWRRTRLLIAAPVMACAMAVLAVFVLPSLVRVVPRGVLARVQGRTLAPGERLIEPRPDPSPRKRVHFVDLHGERVEFGQGSLEGSADNGPARPFVLRHTEVDAEITGFVSDVTVTQEFENPFTTRVEAIYVFPLPDNAAVHEMTLEVGGRKIQGIIQRREDARATYEQARSEGRHAALLDQERPNIFTQSVANIRPGERVKVSLRYVAPLAYDDGTFEFNFPMAVGPRYMPGQALTGEPQGKGTSPDTDRVLDASRISPPSEVGTRSGRDIQVTVRLDAGVEIEGLESTSHRLWLDQRGRRQAVIRLADDDRIPNKDFILRYHTAGPQLRGAVMATGGQDGYFALMLQPAAREALKGEVMPRDIVFLLDTSGSMEGAPLEASKRAVRRAFQSLSPEDRFMLIDFSESASSFRDTPLPATRENLELAQRYLDNLPAGGGTNQLAGIERALTLPREEGRLRVVLLMTDGFIGNEEEIFARTEPLLGDTRLFGFGVGENVNHYFLTRLSQIGRGFYQYIRTDEDPGEAIERFVRRIERPVLTNVQVDWGGLDVRDVQPERVPDLFDNQPLFVVGRYRQPGTATVRVRGLTPHGERVTDVSVTLPEEGGHARALRTLWARSQIEQLDMQRALDRDADTTERITVLGLEYKLVTAFTSFVAVEEAGPAATGKEQTVVVPTAVDSWPEERPRDIARYRREIIQLIPKAPPTDGLRPLNAHGAAGGIDESNVLMGESDRRDPPAPATKPAPTPGVGQVTPANEHALTVQGSLDRELIARVINSYRQNVTYCYQAALTRAPTLAGSITLQWIITTGGKASTVWLANSTLSNPELEACVISRIRTWQFPKPRSGDVTVTYTFHFATPRN